MAVGRSADGLCKLVTLRASCQAAKERRRALLNLHEYKQRRSALFWRLLHFTLWVMCCTVAGDIVWEGFE